LRVTEKERACHYLHSYTLPTRFIPVLSAVHRINCNGPWKPQETVRIYGPVHQTTPCGLSSLGATCNDSHKNKGIMVRSECTLPPNFTQSPSGIDTTQLRRPYPPKAGLQALNDTILSDPRPLVKYKRKATFQGATVCRDMNTHCRPPCRSMSEKNARPMKNRGYESRIDCTRPPDSIFAPSLALVTADFGGEADRTRDEGRSHPSPSTPSDPCTTLGRFSHHSRTPLEVKMHSPEDSFIPLLTSTYNTSPPPADASFSTQTRTFVPMWRDALSVRDPPGPALLWDGRWTTWNRGIHGEAIL
jgi:hypothetical protein